MLMEVVLMVVLPHPPGMTFSRSRVIDSLPPSLRSSVVVVMAIPLADASPPVFSSLLCLDGLVTGTGPGADADAGIPTVP